MPPSPKRLRLNFEQLLQNRIETEESAVAQAPTTQQGENSSSISAASFHFSFPSISSTSSHSSVSHTSSLIPGTLEKQVSTVVVLSTPKSPSSTSGRKLDVEIRSQEGESAKSFLRDVLDKKVADLVHFLLLKYQTKDLITKAERVKIIIKEYNEHFPMILGEVCKFLELVFGIAVTDMDPTNHNYIIYDTLDLTYHSMLSDDQATPKTGLLILILSTVFMEGKSTTEEKIWELLKVMEVYDGKEHLIYGDPRQLITKDWVQKDYLEYHQVPNSDPACYEFLWGPRAHAEIDKKKILEFLAKLKDTIPSFFPNWFKDALKNVGKSRQ